MVPADCPSSFEPLCSWTVEEAVGVLTRTPSWLASLKDERLDTDETSWPLKDSTSVEKFDRMDNAQRQEI